MVDLEDAYSMYLDAQEEEHLDRQRVKRHRRARTEKREALRKRRELPSNA